MLNAAQRDAVQAIWNKAEAQTALDVRQGVVSPAAAETVLVNVRHAIAELDAEFATLLMLRNLAPLTKGEA